MLKPHAAWRLESGNHPPGATMPDFTKVFAPRSWKLDPSRVIDTAAGGNDLARQLAEGRVSGACTSYDWSDPLTRPPSLRSAGRPLAASARSEQRINRGLSSCHEAHAPDLNRRKTNHEQRAAAADQYGDLDPVDPAVLLIWELVSRSRIVNIVLFPPPSVVAVAMREWIRSGEFSVDLATASRASSPAICSAPAWAWCSGC